MMRLSYMLACIAGGLAGGLADAGSSHSMSLAPPSSPASRSDDQADGIGVSRGLRTLQSEETATRLSLPGHHSPAPLAPVRLMGKLSVAPARAGKLMLHTADGDVELAVRANGSFEQDGLAPGPGELGLEHPDYRVGFYSSGFDVRLSPPLTNIGTVPVYARGRLLLRLHPDVQGPVWLRPYESYRPEPTEWLTWPVLRGRRLSSECWAFDDVHGEATRWWLWTAEGLSHGQHVAMATSRLGVEIVHDVSLETPGSIDVRIQAEAQAFASARVVATPAWLAPADQRWIERAKHQPWLPVRMASRQEQCQGSYVLRGLSVGEWSVAVVVADQVVAERSIVVRPNARAQWALACASRLLVQTPDCSVHQPSYRIRLTREGSRASSESRMASGRAASVLLGDLLPGAYRFQILASEGPAIGWSGGLEPGYNELLWACPLCVAGPDTSVLIVSAGLRR